MLLRNLTPYLLSILLLVIVGMGFFIGSLRKELKETQVERMKLELIQSAAIDQLELLQKSRAVEDSLRLLPSKEYVQTLDSIRNADAVQLKRFIESAIR